MTTTLRFFNRPRPWDLLCGLLLLGSLLVNLLPAAAAQAAADQKGSAYLTAPERSIRFKVASSFTSTASRAIRMTA